MLSSWRPALSALTRSEVPYLSVHFGQPCRACPNHQPRRERTYRLYLAAAPLAGEDVVSHKLMPSRARFTQPYSPRLVDAMTLWGKGERAIAEILRVLADYPPARGAVVEYAEVLTEFGFHPDAVLRFPLPDGRDAALSNVLDVLPPVAAVTGAPPDRYVLRPRLGELESDAPSLLMTFWALMFGLSQLARYHPEQWVSALDPNTSLSRSILNNSSMQLLSSSRSWNATGASRLRCGPA